MEGSKTMSAKKFTDQQLIDALYPEVVPPTIRILRKRLGGVDLQPIIMRLRKLQKQGLVIQKNHKWYNLNMKMKNQIDTSGTHA